MIMITILNLYSAFSIYIYIYIQMRFTSMWSMNKDQTTTPGTTCPTLYDECVGSLTSPASEEAGDGAYDLSSLSEKTRISNHLQMSLQRRHILLSYFKTLSAGPVWGSNPRPPALWSDAPTNWANRSAVRGVSDGLTCEQVHCLQR